MATTGKRVGAAVALAAAIAIPAEGLRQWALPSVQSESLPLRPFALQPAVPQFRGNAKLTAPVGEALGDISDSDHSIWAAIALLLRFCGPATILSVVAFVILNSFNGMTGRWLPHIAQEVGEVSPIITHINAAPSVVLVSLVFLVCASLNDVAPRAMSASMRSAMSCFQLGRNLSVFTSTALRFPAQQVLSGANRASAAFTNSDPPPSVQALNGGKATEMAPRQVKRSTGYIACVGAKRSAPHLKLWPLKSGAALIAGFGNDWHKCV